VDPSWQNAQMASTDIEVINLSQAVVRRIFWILALAIFTAMVGVGIIVPLLPIYAEELGASGLWIGLIFSGFSLSRSVFSPLVGRLSDFWGRKTFIATGLFLYWLISLGYLLCNSVGDLVLVRIVQGCSGAMIIPLAMAHIGDIAPEKQEGQYLGSFSVSLFAGFGFGPLLGGLIMYRFGIEANFYLMSLLCFLAFLVVILFLPNMKRDKRPRETRLPGYQNLLKSPVSLGLFLFRFSNAFARGTLIAFLPLIAYSHSFMNTAQIGIVISVNILLVSILQIPFGRLADRWNRLRLVLVGSSGFSLLMSFLPICRGFWQVLFVNLVMGVSGGLAIPAASAIAVDEGRRFGMGSSMGFLNLGMSLGLTAGPILAGKISDLAGLSYAFYLATLVGLAGSIGFASLARKG
jgi:DHA1 family multidrug resistance protein-like MFS transporter